MLEKNSPKPLYQQLKDILVDAIDSEKRMKRFHQRMN